MRWRVQQIGKHCHYARDTLHQTPSTARRMRDVNAQHAGTIHFLMACLVTSCNAFLEIIDFDIDGGFNHEFKYADDLFGWHFIVHGKPSR